MVSNRVDFLDYFRGLMALSVLIYHYSVWSEISYFYPLNQTIMRLGVYSVGAFYVLSGASLTIVYLNNRVSVNFLKDFTVKRVFRIVPLFYLVTTATLLMQLIIGTKLPSWQSIFLNYSVLFGWLSPGSYIATGTWSIGNELVFYSIFPIMLFLMQRSLKQYLIYLVGTLIITGYFSFFVLNNEVPMENQWVSYINPLNQLYLFSFGALIGFYVKRGKKVNRKTLMLLLVASVTSFALLPISGEDRINFVTGYSKVVLSVAVLGVSVFAAFWGNVKSNYFTRVLKYLGDISYGLYLIHPLAYLAMGMALNKLGVNSVAILLVLSVCCTFIASTIVYQYFERYFMKASRRIAKSYFASSKTEVIKNTERA